MKKTVIIVESSADGFNIEDNSFHSEDTFHQECQTPDEFAQAVKQFTEWAKHHNEDHMHLSIDGPGHLIRMTVPIDCNEMAKWPFRIVC